MSEPRHVRLLERKGVKLKEPMIIPITSVKSRDVIEHFDPPIHEMDPHTMKPTGRLQAFRIH